VAHHERFDDLARGLATNQHSRGQVLRMLGGALVGGALASVPGMAWAKPKPRNKCNNNGQCPEGQECCHGSCTTIGTPQNCFGCDDVCDAPGVACCPNVPGTNLFFTCQSLNDIKHCGACNNPCTGADAACCNRTCLNTSSDPNNCGCCDCPCLPTEICQGKLCVCREGLTLCEGVCRNFDTDVHNCGSCGNACSGGKTCQEGICACPSGQTECQGVCRDLQTDPNNCGVCATVCTASQICQSGVCQCPDGRVSEICSCADIDCGPNAECCTLADGRPACRPTPAVACPPGACSGCCTGYPCPLPPVCVGPGQSCPDIPPPGV
jgi:hypothetical protein